MQAKNKECIICHREDQPWFSKKRCKRCAAIEDFKPPEKKTTLKAKKRTPIKKQSEANKKKRSYERAGFGEFFQRMIQRVIDEKICCENCQKPLYNPDSSVVAHILSKSKHLEVAIEDNNVVFLCGIYSDSQCHSKFDSSLSTRKTLSVFKIAAERLKTIKHLIINHSKEYQQFLEYYEQN